MPYASADARRELLGEVERAGDHLSVALSDLSEAFELLDDTTAERLESELFGPVQAAYGRIRRTHDEFARRHKLAEGTFATAARGAPGRGVKALPRRRLEGGVGGRQHPRDAAGLDAPGGDR